MTREGRASAREWRRVGLMMLAVAWGAGQFASMLQVYRGELGFSAGRVDMLFGVYALGLVPGLLVGGRLSDRIGRRPAVLPFVALSPFTSVLLMLGHDSVALLVLARLLAGACSGCVFGAASAWVEELSAGAPAGAGARRATVAMSTGFGLSSLAAGALGEWAPHPLWMPYVPHVLLGATAALLGLRARETVRRVRGAVHAPLLAVPRAVRSARFRLIVAPLAPWVFSVTTLSGVVVPQLVHHGGALLGTAFVGLVNSATLVTGVAVQPLARRIERRRPLRAAFAGMGLAALGICIGLLAVGTGSEPLVVVAAIPFGAAYGTIFVSALRETERLARPDERGATIAVYLALTYTGFAVPYLLSALEGALGGAASLWLTLAALAASLLFVLGAVRRIARCRRAFAALPHAPIEHQRRVADRERS